MKIYKLPESEYAWASDVKPKRDLKKKISRIVRAKLKKDLKKSLTKED